MDLLVQFRCLYYSFCFGFFMMFIVCFVNRLFYKYKVIRFFVNSCMGFILGYSYYMGLVYICYGILRLYYFIMIFIGYLLFMKYYRYKILFYIEKMVRIVNKILSYILFFFVCNNVIMWLKRRLMIKWQREKE